MPTAPPDGSTPRPLTFAFPLSGRQWALRRGTAYVLDGLLNSVDVPGLGYRSGAADGGGLTAVFYVVYGVRGRPGAWTGTVTRWEVEGGRVTRTEEAATGAELVEWIPPAEQGTASLTAGT